MNEDSHVPSGPDTARDLLGCASDADRNRNYQHYLAAENLASSLIDGEGSTRHARRLEIWGELARYNPVSENGAFHRPTH